MGNNIDKEEYLFKSYKEIYLTKYYSPQFYHDSIVLIMSNGIEVVGIIDNIKECDSDEYTFYPRDLNREEFEKLYDVKNIRYWRFLDD